MIKVMKTLPQEREELTRLQEYRDRAVSRQDPQPKIDKLTRRLSTQQQVVTELEKYEATRAKKLEQGTDPNQLSHAWLLSMIALSHMMPRTPSNRVRKALWK